MINVILSIISIIVSVLTLIFCIFKDYGEFIAIYFFAECDYVYVPICCDETKYSLEFIDFLKKEYDESFHICKFKHDLFRDLSKIYYGQYWNEQSVYYDEIFIYSSYKYFSRCIRTHQWHKHERMRNKKLRKGI